MFYIPDPTYVLQIVQYVYPTTKHGIDPVKVYQHNLNDTHTKTGFDDIYGNDGGVYLKLVKIEHKNFHYLNEVMISTQAKKIDFVLS